jgi:hypothetical protein
MTHVCTATTNGRPMTTSAVQIRSPPHTFWTNTSSTVCSSSQTAARGHGSDGTASRPLVQSRRNA